MKDKIIKEAMDWYQKQEQESEINIEDFVNLVIHKTADNIFEKIKTELKNEFDTGNLNHPFIISSEYYLDLKLKDIKLKCKIPIKDEDLQYDAEIKKLERK